MESNTPPWRRPSQDMPEAEDARPGVNHSTRSSSSAWILHANVKACRIWTRAGQFRMWTQAAPFRITHHQPVPGPRHVRAQPLRVAPQLQQRRVAQQRVVRAALLVPRLQLHELLPAPLHGPREVAHARGERVHLQEYVVHGLRSLGVGREQRLEGLHVLGRPREHPRHGVPQRARRVHALVQHGLCVRPARDGARQRRLPGCGRRAGGREQGQQPHGNGRTAPGGFTLH
mmetsp:Transcript_106220/g.310518  ORF Transcript_106220/g.310518 Transcript_106220/m.310518 type:complete len:230 (+) Transcript_106220:26-715(+)